mmetsp:Transcript_2490/g.3509  ORF Transcript_2490/g.3509 Transcript_2490/m.3509 type:complete len:768 (+) Transcript_2490:130-2433(+)
MPINYFKSHQKITLSVLSCYLMSHIGRWMCSDGTSSSYRRMVSAFTPGISKSKPQCAGRDLRVAGRSRSGSLGLLRPFDVVQKLTSKSESLPLSFQRTKYFHTSFSTLHSSAKQTDNNGEDKKQPTNKKKKKMKIKINPNWKEEADLQAAFDDFASKEGFDSSCAFYADGKTFEDDFEYADNDGDDDDDDYLDFGGNPDESGSQSMEDRIMEAKRDMNLNRVTVDERLEKVSADKFSLKELGFKHETNPFGDDETPRKENIQIISNALSCSACGSDFQSKNESKPGYLPPEKYDTQLKLSKIDELQRLKNKANSNEWSAEDEVEWLLQSEGESMDSKKDIDIESMAEELGLDLMKLSETNVICKRCHRLQNFGEVSEELRPGWTEEPLLSQEAFQNLLLPLRQKSAVIIALVDLFDFSGSVLPQLDSIAGDNPVILAANKADLFPSKMGITRAENFVRNELEYIGMKSISNNGSIVRLISCKTGFGITQMLNKARNLAEQKNTDVYIIGAANAGKSTLINHILRKNKDDFKSRKRPGNANARKGTVTESPLPGTTLKFIKVNLGNGCNLYDTPGLLVPGTITQRLTPAELKMIVPKKEVEPVTFRVSSGKCVLIGGLAKIEVIGDSKPFLFTFFVGNDVKLHPTGSDRASEFIEKHAGKMLTPPLDPGPERMKQIGEFESHDIEIDGVGWKEAAADIALRGLGWVSVTGAGTAKVRVSLPKGIGFSVRPPLMPYDVWESTARYTGGRAVRKSTKSKSGKRRRGVGRR